MSLPFSTLVARACAREPHRSALEVASELSKKLNAQRAAKRDAKNAQARNNQSKLYPTKTSWSRPYDNY